MDIDVTDKLVIKYTSERSTSQQGNSSNTNKYIDHLTEAISGGKG